MAQQGGTLDCMVCLEGALRPGRKCVVTRCGHTFCHVCAHAWFQGEAGCPVCRGEINVAKDLITLFSNDPGPGRKPPSGNSVSRLAGPADSAAQLLAGDARDFPVRGVLDRMAERWQEVMLERAKHLQTIGSLNEEVVALEEQLNVALGENKKLKAELRRGDGSGGGGGGGGKGSPTPAAAPGPVAGGAGRPDGPAGWEAADWTEARTFAHHAEPIHGIDVHATEPLVATASWDASCKLFDLERGAVVTTLKGHDEGLYAVAFSPVQANILGTAGADRTCRIWDKKSGACRYVLRGHADEVNGIGFHPAKRVVATASDDRTARIWDYEAGGGELCLLQGHQDSVYGVCFQPGGALVGTASFDRTCKLWDVRGGGHAVHTLEGHAGEVIGVAFAPDGHTLATGSDDGTFAVWDIRTRRRVRAVEQADEVKRVVFSPCGRLLATTCGDGTVGLHGARDFEAVKVLKGHANSVFDAAWAPGGAALVTASHDGTARLWEPRGYGAAS